MIYIQGKEWARRWLHFILILTLALPNQALALGIVNGLGMFASSLALTFNVQTANLTGELNPLVVLQESPVEEVEEQQNLFDSSEIFDWLKTSLRDAKDAFDNLPQPLKRYLMLAVVSFATTEMIRRFGKPAVRNLYPYLDDDDLDELIKKLEIWQAVLFVSLGIQDFNALEVVKSGLKWGTAILGYQLLYEVLRHPSAEVIYQRLLAKRKGSGFEALDKLKRDNPETKKQIEILEKSGEGSTDTTAAVKKLWRRNNGETDNCDKDLRRIAKNIANIASFFVAGVGSTLSTGIAPLVGASVILPGLIGLAVNQWVSSFLTHVSLVQDGRIEKGDIISFRGKLYAVDEIRPYTVLLRDVESLETVTLKYTEISGFGNLSDTARRGSVTYTVARERTDPEAIPEEVTPDEIQTLVYDSVHELFQMERWKSSFLVDTFSPPKKVVSTINGVEQSQVYYENEVIKNLSYKASNFGHRVTLWYDYGTDAVPPQIQSDLDKIVARKLDERGLSLAFAMPMMGAMQ